MFSPSIQIGKVLRVGRGWADVEINHRIRRICTRPDLLVRAGSYLKIMDEQGVSVIPAGDRQVTGRLH